MTESKRRTRPIASRTEPHRSWAQNLGASSPESGGAGRSQAEPGHAEPEPPPRAAPPGAHANGDPAYKSVSDAYRLIDDYLRQGQRFAENIWLPFQGAAGRNQEAFNAPGRLLRAMSDMTSAWLELMQQSTGGTERGRQWAPVGTAGPFAATSRPTERQAPAPRTEAAASPGNPRLRVVVQSQGRVEVNVELHGQYDSAKLVATELRSLRVGADPVRDITVDLTEGALNIVVPDGQPSGIYNGLLLERTSQRPCGTISLSIAGD